MKFKYFYVKRATSPTAKFSSFPFVILSNLPYLYSSLFIFGSLVLPLCFSKTIILKRVLKFKLVLPHIQFSTLSISPTLIQGDFRIMD